MDEGHKDATYIVKETIEGDRVLSQICKVLKSKVWPNDVSNVEEWKCSSPLSRQFMTNIAKCLYFRVLPFSKEGYLQVVQYALHFPRPFNTSIKAVANKICLNYYLLVTMTKMIRNLFFWFLNFSWCYPTLLTVWLYFL